MKKIIYSTATIAILIFSAVSCQRYLDITPTGVVIPKSLEDYRALVTKAYSVYPKQKARVTYRTDEMTLNTSSSYASYYKDIYIWNDTNPDPSTIAFPYGDFYNSIFYCNHIIKNGVSDLPEGAEKNQILGEAYALRALNYFELSNLYSDVYVKGQNDASPAVPLILEPKLEGDFPKSTLGKVYEQILSDLNKAEQLINVSKFDAGLNYRFSQPALHAFKARVYQYSSDWNNAITEVNKALSYNNSLEDFNDFKVLPVSFKSTESIMNLDFNVDADLNSLANVSPSLLKLYDQQNDLRFARYFKKNGSRTLTTKYSSSSEFKCSFRVGELMLIKAEALAKTNNEGESKKILLALAAKRYNAVGISAYQSKINSLAGAAYYSELLNERLRETCFEGLRWYDLRRTTKPAITHSLEGKDYLLNQSDPRYTLPYPKDARLRNPAL